MLDAKQHQGKFGEDYVRVLASAAGLVVLKEDIDVNGVDLGFRATGRYGRVFSPFARFYATWTPDRHTLKGAATSPAGHAPRRR